ncbi:6-phosphogluconate dehydrogenase [Sphingomonas spermidinifaciens]|uniref:6-phosphogluconate dehydrogenase n=1 Tax=Sphingomonas spermidinifaciens TaxID=1141889 RepID=A0A2A4BAG9_9SPHN|nr:NAD(P)-dependent oxidoreductase [Sphingomonas spermidinifaciens]PCD04624.1 6-phosphogluconate dehydrogenase [Sphingomonas spermidinifaciens]
MVERIATIGFGEAAGAFAGAWAVAASAYDLKLDDPATREGMVARFASHGVAAAADVRTAIDGADLILSLVTAGSAMDAARAAAVAIAPGQLFCDMNSVAPDTKRAAQAAIERAGGRYVDVAVLAPVFPKRLAVPLLLSGAHAADAAAAVREAGFTDVSVLDGPVGAASSVKMIRSVMVKGIEALTAECVLAAASAGVLDEVLASLDASPPPRGWAAIADYNLDRMMLHGRRRAEEMREVVKTLDALGTGSVMTRGTVERQDALARPGAPVPEGLPTKLDTLLGRVRAEAAE